MEDAFMSVAEAAEALAADAVACDEANQLTEHSAAILRRAGIIRMLQTKDYGGREERPEVFCEAVMDIASKAPGAGWVAGVVGVHPFQFSWLDERLQHEVWGDDPDTWIASPYAPQGVARKTEGGFIFSGRWSFSSGTDSCQWVILAGVVADEEGNVLPGQVRHLALPRSDYEIVPDSWQVSGLSGSGSKDVLVKDAFVPEYRTAAAEDVFGGTLAADRRPGHPLYALPFNVAFPAAITSATIGIAQGVVDRYREYMAERVDVLGVKGVDHPFRMAVLGSATADIEASRLQVLSDLAALYEQTSRGEAVTQSQHYAARRNQVRSVRRAYEAALSVYRHAGGTAGRLDNPLQRFLRDLNLAMGHAANQDDLIYQAEAMHSLGAPIPAGTYI